MLIIVVLVANAVLFARGIVSVCGGHTLVVGMSLADSGLIVLIVVHIIGIIPCVHSRFFCVHALRDRNRDA